MTISVVCYMNLFQLEDLYLGCVTKKKGGRGEGGIFCAVVWSSSMSLTAFFLKNPLFVTFLTCIGFVLISGTESA